jgi:hypothetical protein
VEDRISGLKDKIDIKGKKPEESLDKTHKTCKKNKQELSNSRKRPNL